MAELSIVIIVGCCPYIPRIIRRNRAYTSGDGNSHEVSPPLSKKSKRIAFGISPLGDFISTLQSDSNYNLELHGYGLDSIRTNSEHTNCTRDCTCKSFGGPVIEVLLNFFPAKTNNIVCTSAPV